MSVDDERLLRRIQIIRENLAHLRTLRALSEGEFLSDFRNVESAKHLLQTSIEAVIDIGVSILANLKEPLPETHADVFEVLSRYGIVPAASAPIYRAMVGFRNRVVHLYDRVDDRRVFEIVREELDDLERFISHVLAFQPPQPSG